jgi:predicted DCC family thiol-disulfide oxidoreductase YuxK
MGRPRTRSGPKPVLVYDGDCGFCTRCVRLVERMGADVQIVAWQFADLPALGLTESAAADALQWVEPDGTIRAGHEAVAALLIRSNRLWALVGKFILLPGISAIAARVYRLVADNRDRLPGGTPACALPPDQRPGAASSGIS